MIPHSREWWAEHVRFNTNDPYYEFIKAFVDGSTIKCDGRELYNPTFVSFRGPSVYEIVEKQKPRRFI